jgi:hypothetical protein
MPYQKFSARFKNETPGDTPSNPPKAPKVVSACANERRTLGILGALGGGRAQTEKCEPPAVWTNAHEERAAIIEYDGVAPRVWAEALARLDPNKSPADVPQQRWLQFIDDCGRFLDAGWAARAAVWGWGPFDLFGCDRERPFARVDHMGLIWLVNGGAIVELHRDRAHLKTAGGAFQTFRRRPIEVGRVALPWSVASDGKDA